MRQTGNGPADGVGHIQRLQGAVGSKDGVHPTHAEDANTDNGNDHGHEAVAHAAQTADHHVHHTAEEVRQSHDA